ncbi:MAG: caspase family protein, partial [Chloroflexota bacterium]
MPEKKVHALLVAIDNYDPSSNVTNLAGCKNDIVRINAFLQERIGAAYQEPITLFDDEATKANIIKGFQNLKSRAGAEDSVLFYYSGHGSQAMTDLDFWDIEPDKLDETLVCYDSRTRDGSDLADKELFVLISELASTGAHLTMVLDCCHSGSGTRDVGDENVRSRRVKTDARPRTADRGYFFEGDGNTNISETISVSGWFDLPEGDHVLLSACRSEQTAKEMVIEGENRGIFSHYLLDALQSAGPEITYRDVFSRVKTLVQSGVAEQNPQLESVGEISLNQPFLGGAIQELDAYYTLAFEKNPETGEEVGWTISGGAVNGISKVDNSRTTELAVFPFSATADLLGKSDQALGKVKVTEVQPGRSLIQTIGGDIVLDNDQTYKAVVTQTPNKPLDVVLKGDQEACDLVRHAIRTASVGGSPSLLVEESKGANGFFEVTAENGTYTILRTQDGYPLVEGDTSSGYSEDDADTVIKRLEHIATWHNRLALHNPQSRIKADDIEITIKVKQGMGDGSDRFYPLEENQDFDLYCRGLGGGEQPILDIEVKNKTDKPLYCMPLVFTEAYDIEPLVREIGGYWIQPGKSTKLRDGQVYTYITKQQWEDGIQSLKHNIKLILSTQPSQASDFELATLRILPKRTRAAGPPPTEDWEDWQTVDIPYIVYQPKGNALPSAGSSTNLLGVTIEGHSGLAGTVELKSVTMATRSTEGEQGSKLPKSLRDRPDMFQPFEFATGQRGSSGMSVLEIGDATGTEHVSPDEPLNLTLNGTLAENEALLALGMVDGFLVPLDIVTQSQNNQTKVALKRLPDSAITTRSFKRSVRILFQKYLSEKVGYPTEFPRLAAVELDGDKKLKYITKETEVKDLVASADSVALYIHGIFGDTNVMAPSGFPEIIDNDMLALKKSHDVLLTFDYENINTTLQDVAKQLQDKLADVGLLAGHDKTLNIVAHSMGGLVSRWFIEHLDGRNIVNHLVMLGTPNAGSPWPKVEDWVITGVTIGLNALESATWYVRALSGIVAGIEKLDVSLDQMAPGSDFLKMLADSANPDVPYTVIAGNTQAIRGEPIFDPDAKGVIAWLMSGLKAENRTHALADIPFWGQPNDVAVSVKSVHSIPAGWDVTKLEIPSSHFTYFALDEGL